MRKESRGVAICAAEPSALRKTAFVMLTPRRRLTTSLTASRAERTMRGCVCSTSVGSGISHVRSGRGAKIFAKDCTVGPLGKTGAPV